MRSEAAAPNLRGILKRKVRIHLAAEFAGESIGCVPRLDSIGALLGGEARTRRFNENASPCYDWSF